MTPRIVVRPMRLEDIPQVVAIDRVSFSTPWPANAYQFEITHRDTSHLAVLEWVAGNEGPRTGIRKFMQRILGDSSTGPVIGYGGCESNRSAQALYRKYEFKVAGRRKRYYRDNGEDALLMEARPLDASYLQRLNHRLALLAQRIQFEDRFTE